MDTKRLPPSLLMALGLTGCPAEGEAMTTACLNVDPSATSTSEPGSTGSESVSTSIEPQTSSGSGSGTESGTESSGTTFGPCLDVLPPTSSSSGTDTDTDTDTGTGTSTTGGGGGQQDAVRQGVLERLPPDVAAKLRGGG